MIPSYIQVVMLIMACYGFSYLLMQSLAAVSSKYVALRLFLFPGVVVHESAHALACFLTATPIDSISFWTESGGHVIHHKPRFSIVTQPFISFAPFPVGVLSLIVLGQHIRQASWVGIIFLLWLMVSIAATLAPSKTDMLHAFEGSVVVLGLAILYHLAFPASFMALVSRTGSLIHPLQTVTGILLAFWVVVLLLQSNMRSKRH